MSRVKPEQSLPSAATKRLSFCRPNSDPSPIMSSRFQVCSPTPRIQDCISKFHGTALRHVPLSGRSKHPHHKVFRTTLGGCPISTRHHHLRTPFSVPTRGNMKMNSSKPTSVNAGFKSSKDLAPNPASFGKIFLQDQFFSKPVYPPKGTDLSGKTALSTLSTPAPVACASVMYKQSYEPG